MIKSFGEPADVDFINFLVVLQGRQNDETVNCEKEIFGWVDRK